MLRMGTWSEPMTLHSGAIATAVGETFPVCPQGNTTSQENVTGSYETLVVQITGVTTGVVTFQANVDNTNWVAIGLTDMADDSTVSTTVTNANGLFILKNCKGLSQFRANITTWTTGTFIVTVLGAA